MGKTEERDGWIKGEGQELESGAYFFVADEEMRGEEPWDPQPVWKEGKATAWKGRWYKLRELAPKRPEPRIEDKLVEGRWYLCKHKSFKEGLLARKYEPPHLGPWLLSRLDEIWTINEGTKGERLK